MTQSRHLVMPLTVAAIALIFYPLVEVGMTAWPLRLDNTGWRFGVQGLISTKIFFPLLGFLLLMAAAALSDSVRRARITEWAALFTCVLLLIMLGSFTLDALQMYSTRPEPQRLGFRRVTMAAMLHDGMVLLSLVAVWWGTRRMAKEMKPVKARTHEAALVGRTATMGAHTTP